MKKPDPSEYPPYFQKYIDRVETTDLLSELRQGNERFISALENLPEERAGYRYAPGKWSIRELVNHVTDSERVYAYRMLWFARGEEGPLPGFEQDDWIRYSDADAGSLSDLLAEHRAVREATIRMIGGFPESAWTRQGTANNHRMSVRALAFVIPGHEAHHLEVLKERYGVQTELV